MRAPLFIHMPLAAAPHDPATDTLSLWLRGDDELTGDLTTLAWGSRASAGASGSASFLHAGSNEVTQPGTAFDGFTTVYFAGATPRLDGAEYVHTTLLGGGDDVAASYTAAYVIQPLSAAAHTVDGGGLYVPGFGGNPTILVDAGDVVGHIISSDGGTAKFGAYHYESGVGYGATAPVVWPGGFGTWGLLWFVWTVASTMKMRVKTVGSGAVESTQAIAQVKMPAAGAGLGFLGAIVLGITARVAEIMIWPGQALSGAQITAREQGYFKTRYPTLGL